MKLYEIQHINQKYNPNKVMGEELRFVSEVSKISEKFYPAEKQPKDWDHVRRLSRMLFLAWNDDNPCEGTVYLGEFYTPKPDPTEEFYKFFEKFNGFPINDDQKMVFSLYNKENYNCGLPRRCGATVLLLTIAAWESINGNRVIHISSNHDLRILNRRNFNYNNLDLGEYLPHFTTISNNDSFQGIHCDVMLYDCVGPLSWEYLDISDRVEKTLSIQTNEFN